MSRTTMPRVMNNNGTSSIAPEDPRHGSERGYSAGCRRPCCRSAHAVYSQIKKRERIARGIPDYVHGTRNGYNNWDCRCDRCQIATVGSYRGT